MTLVKFSITILTFNRHELLQLTISSVVEQNYTNFEILVIDNSSTPSVHEIVAGYCDQRIRIKRIPENIHVCDALESALDEITGTHFLFLADDDVLVPDALSSVARFFNEHIDAQMVCTGNVMFNHHTKASNVNPGDLKFFTNDVQSFEGREHALACCNGWGIGPKKKFKSMPSALPSATYISLNLIRITKRRQGMLFVKPFGDIGYVGCMANTDKVYYMNSLLTIIGLTPVRETLGCLAGYRRKWDREIQYLQHSPIKAPSFLNMGTDAHLQVLFKNGLDHYLDSRLRPNFFVRHLRQVISDKPWDSRTINDIIETLPHYCKSLIMFAPHSIWNGFLSFPRKCRREFARVNARKKSEKKSSNFGKQKLFKDILEFAKWVKVSSETGNVL